MSEAPGRLAWVSLHSLGMREDTRGVSGGTVIYGGADVLIDVDREGDGAAPGVSPAVRPARMEPSRRRFIRAMIAATAVAAVPFLWVLWALWGSPNPVRRAILQTNFYDLQARAIFHGHLWIPNGSIGIEGFAHDGHQYTYFGLFPSILRMPILLVDEQVGRSAGDAVSCWSPGWSPACSPPCCSGGSVSSFAGTRRWAGPRLLAFGMLMATIMGGSVWLILAATPYVFNEDLAWSICLTTGSLFALLGRARATVVGPSGRQRPAHPGRQPGPGHHRLGVRRRRRADRRVVLGWAAAGRRTGGGRSRIGGGLVPLVVGCAVNYAKFGVPFGIPVTDQVYSSVNAYRRRFLAANHNSEVGIAFMPDQPRGLPATGRLAATRRCSPSSPCPRPQPHPRRGALRQAVPDREPARLDAAPLPVELLGAGHRVPARARRRGWR